MNGDSFIVDFKFDKSGRGKVSDAVGEKILISEEVEVFYRPLVFGGREIVRTDALFPFVKRVAPHICRRRLFPFAPHAGDSYLLKFI